MCFVIRFLYWFQNGEVMLIEFYVCSYMKNHWNQLRFQVMFWPRSFNFSVGCHQHYGSFNSLKFTSSNIYIEIYTIFSQDFSIECEIFMGCTNMNVVSSIERDISKWDTICFVWWMGLHCYGNWNWNWEILLGNTSPQSLHTFHGFEFHTGREYWLNIGFCLSRELQWKLFHSLCVSEYGWVYSQWQWSAWILFTLVKYFHDFFLKTRKTVMM